MARDPYFKIERSVPDPEPGTDFRFELPAKFGVGRSKLWVPGHIYPEIKVDGYIF